MSNILIIKHGSLGDLIQANGAIKDIKKFYQNRKVFLLTSQPYAIFMSECPYIDGVIIDKRLPRWNLFYLNNLKKNLRKYEFSKVFDLQNSRRTKFYRRFIIKNVEWSSSETSLEPGQKKKNIFYRPWGRYTNLYKGKNFLIKELYVKPKGILSLQKHFHRSEHWVVTQGTPKITLNKKKFFLKTNETIFIPVKSIHRIENPYNKPVKIIEAQLGSILKETDIFRYQDIYGRVK